MHFRTLLLSLCVCLRAHEGLYLHYVTAHLYPVVPWGYIVIVLPRAAEIMQGRNITKETRVGMSSLTFTSFMNYSKS